MTDTSSETKQPGAAARHKVLIIGGGNAGISVAAQLRRKLKGLDVAIIEPSEKHYYQPLWTLVGGGVFRKQVTERPEASVIPKGVTWLQDSVTEIRPEENAVITASGESIGYDYLVVAPGIQVNWGQIEGLEDALGKNGVCSNYSYDLVDKTWEFIDGFKGGTALFTQPATPIKCGGAPQKIAYLADDTFRKHGVRAETKLLFMSGQPSIFAVEKYANTLRKVIERREIDARFRESLVKVDGEAREATFQNLDSGERTVIHYDLLHVVPPMSAPDFIRNGPLANADGWVDVDRETLRHTRYANIYALGDASSLPTSKTGAAVRKQAPVLVKNLVAAILGGSAHAKYDGYTACPLVTGYGRLVMAEFDYNNQPKETFPFDQSKERWSMYQFKARILPRMYWWGILKGRM
ncbi:MAG: NAD(P)/FAD-dependent oxidoreductase [Dehalococcoidia bacterium]|nr:NAD(P)/FAD-dependent oxidoreductase [Dehalococcoidia bacterium]